MVEEVDISHACLSESAVRYRERTLLAFSPSFQEKPRSARTIQFLVATLFNGDWRRERVQHTCVGCCQNRQEAVLKMKAAVSKLWKALTLKQIMNDANWKQWHTSLYPIGFFTLLHNVFSRAFAETFRPQTTLGDHEVEGLEWDLGHQGNDLSANSARVVQGDGSKDTKVAVEWWQRRDAKEQLVILRCCLSPQTQLMDKVLRNTDAGWDLRRLVLAAGLHLVGSPTAPPPLPTVMETKARTEIRPVLGLSSSPSLG